VPDEVVVRAGLAVGLELDRSTLRRIRRELARARGMAVAARTLARRDASADEVRTRLARARVEPSAAVDVVASLERAGALDDGRLAGARASALAARGYGNAAILARLEAAGVDEALAREAVGELAPEADRARLLAATQADRANTARLLARRGFPFDVVEDVVGVLDSGA
jgi:regulatory protein